MGIFSFLFGGCSKKSPAPLQPPSTSAVTEITAGSEEGFVDLTFAIRTVETLADGSRALTAYGVHQGREVGVKVVFGPQWKAGTIGQNPALLTYTGIITYHSIGTPSDALVQILDELYGTKLHPASLQPQTTFAAMSLGGDPRDLAREPAKMKLFFEPESADRYAEVYTNVDLAKHVLEIREKDPGYRPAIIKALQAKKDTAR